jgi:hypothetical protein
LEKKRRDSAKTGRTGAGRGQPPFQVEKEGEPADEAQVVLHDPDQALREEPGDAAEVAVDAASR